MNTSHKRGIQAKVSADLTENVDRELLLNVCLRLGLEQADLCVASVIDEDVDMSKARNACGDGRIYARLVLNIKARDEDITVLCEFRCLGRVAHGSDNIPTFSSEKESGRMSNARGSTSEEDSFGHLMQVNGYVCRTTLKKQPPLYT